MIMTWQYTDGSSVSVLPKKINSKYAYGDSMTIVIEAEGIKE